jgi:hypothetical protein
MHVPALLPDELIGSYMWRLGRLNGMASGEAALKALYDDPGRQRGRSACPTPFELIAQVARVDKARLMCAHTLVPLRQAISPGRKPIAHGDDRRRAVERRWYAAALCTGQRSCPRCISEDVSFWGFDYARRSAQLPGVDWCAKHGVPLHRPGYSQMANAAEPIELAPAEHRYAEITDAFQDMPQSTPLPQASIRLRHRVRQAGLRLRRGSSGPALSSLAASVMPRRWLELHRPHLLAGRYDDRLDAVHTSPIQPFATEDYVLALTVLYPSADEALTDFLRPLSAVEVLQAEDLARKRRGLARVEPGAATRATSDLSEAARQ